MNLYYADHQDKPLAHALFRSFAFLDAKHHVHSLQHHTPLIARRMCLVASSNPQRTTLGNKTPSELAQQINEAYLCNRARLKAVYLIANEAGIKINHTPSLAQQLAIELEKLGFMKGIKIHAFTPVNANQLSRMAIRILTRNDCQQEPMHIAPTEKKPGDIKAYYYLGDETEPTTGQPFIATHNVIRYLNLQCNTFTARQSAIKPNRVVTEALLFLLAQEYHLNTSYGLFGDTLRARLDLAIAWLDKHPYVTKEEIILNLQQTRLYTQSHSTCIHLKRRSSFYQKIILPLEKKLDRLAEPNTPFAQRVLHNPQPCPDIKASNQKLEDAADIPVTPGTGLELRSPAI